MTRLAIIAGQGHLPLQVARAADEQGLDVVIFPIVGQADGVFDGFVVQPVRLGAIGQTQAFLRHHGCRQMVMVGKVVWPSLGALRPDTAGMKLLGKLTKRGDDTVLRVISQFFAEHGVQTLPVNMFLEGHMMPSGHVAGPSVDDHGQILIEIGASILDKLGACDVGQSVIVQNGRVLAIEAAEGTDQMLKRVIEIRKRNKTIHENKGVLIKMAKKNQSRLVDLPVLGPKTIEIVSKANLASIALDPLSTLVLNKETFLKKAKKESINLFLA